MCVQLVLLTVFLVLQGLPIPVTHASRDTFILHRPKPVSNVLLVALSVTLPKSTLVSAAALDSKLSPLTMSSVNVNHALRDAKPVKPELVQNAGLDSDWSTITALSNASFLANSAPKPTQPHVLPALEVII